MTYNFCTLFDKNYLLKGLALHDSLIRHAGNFKLWILCMDGESYQILNRMNLENVELISLSDFEDEQLLSIKPTRKKSEYCWTCTPSLPLYILKKHRGIDMVSYLDADLFFYNSPKSIYDEFGNKSIMIIPHNFSEDQKHREKTSGIYNVGMLIFRNDINAIECLEWWRERCLEWCFDTYQDGKLGDQLYLDNWPEKFKNVHILKNRGANVASWNIREYNSSKWPLLFYHFHGAQLYKSFSGVIANNQVEGIDDYFIFNPYSRSLSRVFKQVRQCDPFFYYGVEPLSKYLVFKIKILLHPLKKLLA